MKTTRYLATASAKRKIDAGRHARRTPDRSVAHKDWIGFNTHLGETASKFGAIRPMGDGSAPIEQTGRRQQKCPGAD
jgi:hypothetical protein